MKRKILNPDPQEKKLKQVEEKILDKDMQEQIQEKLIPEDLVNPEENE